MRNFSILVLLLVFISAQAEPNCNIYKMEGNQACYEACMLATTGGGAQGSRQSQEKFDQAIEQCPSLDYAHMEKSVPYLKRGDFIAWKKLIDKAVEANPLGQLGYRGWCRYQFLRDYKGAIQDFERLDSLTQFDIGYSQNGDYQLNFAKALCYKALRQKEKALAIMEQQLDMKDYSPMPFDFLHVGVLKMELGDTTGAVEYFQKSIALNDYFADTHYYLGIIYKSQKNMTAFRASMEKAKAFYLKGYKRFDPYTTPMDKVFLTDIDRELTYP